MAIEIEAKMAVEDFAPIRARLLERGARLLGRYHEINTFFDTPDGSLVRADKGLRLRVKRNLDTQEEQYIITFKGPKQRGPLKSREEIEANVANPADAQKLLEGLGYQKVLLFEKRRESYEFERCEVELDEVPSLGLFVEIEGPDESSVLRAREMLALGDREMIRTGYASMLASRWKESGSREREIRFG
jgi:adenylate cyclase class 2